MEKILLNWLKANKGKRAHYRDSRISQKGNGGHRVTQLNLPPSFLRRRNMVIAFTACARRSGS